MSKEKNKKVFYYDDELNNDFAEMNIKKCTVDESFKYRHDSLLWRICAFVLYHVIAYPLIWIFARVILGVRFVNKSAVKKYKKTPYFLYGNHTGWVDAYTPNIISAPRKNQIIVAPDTVSIKGLKNIVQMLGAIPIPEGAHGLKKFSDAIDHHHKSCNITVYPEAHIWPFYNGVRNFSDSSFCYPIKYGCPTFAFFTAYTAPRGFLSFLRKANITVYVSDAIFPDEGLCGAAARKNLRDKVYNFMLEKSKYSDYKVYEYLPISEKKSALDSVKG